MAIVIKLVMHVQMNFTFIVLFIISSLDISNDLKKCEMYTLKLETKKYFFQALRLKVFRKRNSWSNLVNT